MEQHTYKNDKYIFFCAVDYNNLWTVSFVGRLLIFAVCWETYVENISNPGLRKCVNVNFAPTANVANMLLGETFGCRGT